MASSTAIWWIPGLPLAAAALIALFHRPLGEKSHWPCWIAIFVSFLLSIAVFLGEPAGATVPLYEWMDFAHTDVRLWIPVSAHVDALTAIMLLVVTGVGLLVAIFSAGYLRGDAGYARFFAEFSLFVFAMTGLVLAGNFFLVYMFWEGVGLCSYLLIGFWFSRPAAAAAAKKAFLVNRIGDFGFLLGILLLWATFDDRLDFAATLADPAAIEKVAYEHPAILSTICLLLLCGAIGKSAQFPLHVWLPDAMEGPTPASALIHAATMVAAGVYLVARCTPLFVHAPFAQMTVGGIGATTALLAALIALTQHDLKRVLAYSTLSQLGYMFLALGAAGADEHLAGFAVTAAIFHLVTHACFKALLFLSAGSVMHAMGDVIDMRKFGGLRHALPITHWSFLAGALALAGLPIFSGFWSKDEILAAAFDGSRTGEHRVYYFVLFAVGMLTAGLTAFYTFRAYFRTFWGDEKFPPEAGHHPHDAPPVMAIPLAILSVFALGIGLALGPTHLFEKAIAKTTGLPESGEHHASMIVMASSIVLGLLGAGIAWRMYGARTDLPERLAERFPLCHRLSYHRFYFDEMYQYAIVGPLEGFARLLWRNDESMVDGFVDFLGSVPAWLGRGLRFLQNGLVQSYAWVTLAGVAVLLVMLLRNL